MILKNNSEQEHFHPIMALKKDNKKKSMLSKNEARMAADANDSTLVLLRFTCALRYQNILQIKTDITGSLKLIAKGCSAITLSTSSPQLFPLTASSRVFQPAVKSAFAFISPFKGKACQRNLVHSDRPY